MSHRTSNAIYPSLNLSSSSIPSFFKEGYPLLSFTLSFASPPYPVNHQALIFYFLRISRVSSLFLTPRSSPGAGHCHLSPMHDCDRLLTGHPLSSCASCPSIFHSVFRVFLLKHQSLFMLPFETPLPSEKSKLLSISFNMLSIY